MNCNKTVWKLYPLHPPSIKAQRPQHNLIIPHQLIHHAPYPKYNIYPRYKSQNVPVRYSRRQSRMIFPLKIICIHPNELLNARPHNRLRCAKSYYSHAIICRNAKRKRRYSDRQSVKERGRKIRFPQSARVVLERSHFLWFLLPLLILSLFLWIVNDFKRLLWIFHVDNWMLRMFMI